MEATDPNMSEKGLHEAAIEALASELHRTVSEIKPHYDRELTRLQAGARIRDFLSVCATRGTRMATTAARSTKD